jgi:hypothetical protein
MKVYVGWYIEKLKNPLPRKTKLLSRRGGFIIQRHNELRDLEAELLSMVCNLVCNDVEIEYYKKSLEKC